MHNIINVPIQPLWRNPQKYPELNPQTQTQTQTSSSLPQTTPVKTETVAAVTPAATNFNFNNNNSNKNSAEKLPNDNTPSGVSKEVSSEEVGDLSVSTTTVQRIDQKSYLLLLSFVVCRLSCVEAAVRSRGVSTGDQSTSAAHFACVSSGFDPLVDGLRRGEWRCGQLSPLLSRHLLVHHLVLVHFLLLQHQQ